MIAMASSIPELAFHRKKKQETHKRLIILLLVDYHLS